MVTGQSDAVAERYVVLAMAAGGFRGRLEEGFQGGGAELDSCTALRLPMRPK